MTSFEAGFINQAKESGLSDHEAAHFLKRASEYPGSQELFKRLPDNEDNQDPSSFESLANLVKQEAIDKQFSGYKKKIEL